MGEFNQTKYINDYNKEKYDIIRIPFPKGYKEKLKERAKQLGHDSMSGYIKQLVDADMKTIGGGKAPAKMEN